MLVRQFLYTGYILLIFVCFEGCSSSKQSSYKGADPQAPQSTIRCGGGGGFSGYYSGNSISSNGLIISWQKKSVDAPDSILWQRKITPDSVSFFFQYLREIDFQSVTTLSHGNMNYTIEISDEKQRRALSWGDTDPKVQPEIKVFYKLLYNFVERLKRSVK